MQTEEKSIRARLLKRSVLKLKRMAEMQELDTALSIDVQSRDPFQRAMDALDSRERTEVELVYLK